MPTSKIAIAVAAACASISVSSYAGIISTNAASAFPGLPAPGNVSAPTTSVLLANGETVTLDAGSSADLGALIMRGGSTLNLVGVPGTLFGQPNTQIDLFAPGGERLITRGFTPSVINVTQGAYFQTDAGGCTSFTCYLSVIGSGAGNSSTINFNGGYGFFNQIQLGSTFLPNTSVGVPGGTASGTMNITNGGAVTSAGQSSVGLYNINTGVNTAADSAVGSVLVSGAGSSWKINPLFQSLPNSAAGTPSATSQQALVNVANGSNTTGTLTVSNGGQVLISGIPTSIPATGSTPAFNSIPGLSVATGGNGLANAQGTVNVTGAGSKLLFEGAAFFNIGGAAPATATPSTAATTTNVNASVNVTGGGYVGSTAANGLTVLQVGRGGTGTQATLTISGSNSLVEVAGTLHPGSGGPANGATVNIGRDGAVGTLRVENGGELRVTTPGSNASVPLTGPRVFVGSNAAQGMGGQGTLVIDGPGSKLIMQGDPFNPVITLGNASTGSMSVLNGGLVQMTGPAGNTPVSGTGSITINVGGTTTVGGTAGTGSLTVSGAGSTIDMTGVNNRFIGVGRGAGSSGTFTVGSGATINTQAFSIGDGGSGVMNMSGGTINLSGITASTGTGGFTVGRAGGTGSISMTGGVINLNNPVGGFTVGGSNAFAGAGSGSIAMSNGAQIVFGGTGSPGASIGTAGGSGSLVMTGTGTAITMNGGTFSVGSASGSVGSVDIGAGSSLTGAGTIRIAHDGTNSVGSGSLKVNGLVSANTIINGTNGLISGAGTLQGNITNFGTINPGNSPGTLRIDGILDNQGGKIILEVQEVAPGVFVTDKIILASSAILDLTNTQIEFQFLGGTNAAAFAAQGPTVGIDLEEFFGRETAQGGIGALSSSDLAEFGSAIFSTSDSQGAPAGIYEVSVLGTIIGDTTGAVPLPGTLVLLGWGLVAFRKRRQS
jgi:T5SS/PEP-CTERM-associated repeat protein